MVLTIEPSFQPLILVGKEHPPIVYLDIPGAPAEQIRFGVANEGAQAARGRAIHLEIERDSLLQRIHRSPPNSGSHLHQLGGARITVVVRIRAGSLDPMAGDLLA